MLSSKTGKKAKLCNLISFHQYSTKCPSQCDKKIKLKKINVKKEEINLSFLIHNMIVCLENPKESMKAYQL